MPSVFLVVLSPGHSQGMLMHSGECSCLPEHSQILVEWVSKVGRQARLIQRPGPQDGGLVEEGDRGWALVFRSLSLEFLRRAIPHNYTGKVWEKGQGCRHRGKGGPSVLPRIRTPRGGEALGSASFHYWRVHCIVDSISPEETVVRARHCLPISRAQPGP